MERKFSNVNPPIHFTNWVIKNLKMCFSRDSIIEASESNKKFHPEDADLFNNLINEMYLFSHSEVLNYYNELSSENVLANN